MSGPQQPASRLPGRRTSRRSRSHAGGAPRGGVRAAPAHVHPRILGAYLRYRQRLGPAGARGNLRIGHKTVIGTDTHITCHLDIEIGAECLVSDGVHVADFDHRHDRIDVAIRSQGIRTTPVRSGHEVWVVGSLLPDGMTPQEALELRRGGKPLPGETRR